MCIPDKPGRPNVFCLIPLGLLNIILGAGLIGSWVACFYKCGHGKVVEYNYYAAVWTGGLALLGGILQVFLACFWNKALKYFLICFNVVLVLCCLLCGALYSYNAYLENRDFPIAQPPSLGLILTVLEAALAVLILTFIMIWNCLIGCASLDEDPEMYNNGYPRRATNKSRGPVRQHDAGGPYDNEFFNREPRIYQSHNQYEERPQEVSYGNHDSGYVIPRASLRGEPVENGHARNGGTMLVDGRETFPRQQQTEEHRGFYSGSSRYAHQNGSAYQNGALRQNGFAHQKGGALPNGVGSRGRNGNPRSSDFAVNHYGQGISLMEMHGVAPTSNDITDGYY